MKMRAMLSVALAAGALFFTIPSLAAEPVCAPDRACYVACVQELNECRLAAQKEAHACGRACVVAQQEADKICAGQGRDTRACKAAVRKAQECIRECRASLKEALEVCVTSSLECIDECRPDATEPVVE